LPAAYQTRLRGHEFQMIFVAKPLWLGDHKRALIDAGRLCWNDRGRRLRRFLFAAGRYDVLSSSVVARWSGDRGGIVRVETNPRCRHPQLRWFWRALAIKFKPKRPAKRRQSTLGRIGFGGLDGRIVGLARGRAASFAGAMPLAYDGGAIRLHRDPDPGKIYSEKIAAILAGKNATGFDCFAAPSIETENLVCL